MNNKIFCGVTQKLQGYCKVGVVNPITKEVKWNTDGWDKNLILNQGMNNIYSMAIVDQMLYAISGFGTRPNSIDGGTSEITQSANNVYLNVTTGLSDFTSSAGTYAAAVQVGDMLKYANNSESMVSSVTDGFNLVVTPSYTFTSGQTFTIWKTSQTELQTEVSRSNSYLVGAGNCESTIASNVITHRRTYDFPVETAQQSYNEIGIGWTSGTPSTVFSRILLSGPVVVDTGLMLRVIYDLQTTWQPSASLYTTASIGGWPVAPSTTLIGSESLQVPWTSKITPTNGASYKTPAVLDPYYVSDTGIMSVWASPVSTSLAAFSSSVDRSTNVGYTTAGEVSKAAYINNSFYSDRTGVLPIAAAARSDLRSVGFGVHYVPGGGSYNYYTYGNGQVYCFLFDQPQTKLPTQTLSLTFRTSWARTLA